MKKTLIFVIAITAILSFKLKAQNTFPSSGNVGIGTTTPGAPLEVNGNVQVDGLITTVVPSNGNTFIQAATNGTLATGLGSNTSTTTNAYGAPANSSFVGNAQGYPFVFTTAAAERMRISTNGNIGIGTITPNYLLDVNGGIHTSDFFYGTGVSLAGGSIQAASTNASYISGVTAIGNDGSVNLGGTLTVSLAGYNGNVGIGTTTPDEKLAVNGTIHSQEVRVDLSGWEDKVFKRTYKLLNLSTVKNYINLNHHLPNMPSESELIKTGLNVGNMEKILTKKVEELTLYMIEKDKQVSDLQKEIEQLKDQLNLIIKEVHKN